MTNQQIYVTDRLNVAIYLHAIRALQFLGCRMRGITKIDFVFDDPSKQGSQHELDFELGKAAPVRDIFASQKFMRRAMTATQEENRNTRIVNDGQHAAVSAS